MRVLLEFVIRYSATILFVLLELLCFFMIVRFNASQREIYTHSASLFTGSIFNKREDLTQFVNLKEENKILMDENARLIEELSTYRSMQDSVEVDSLLSYKVVPAQVINQTINLVNNHLTLNKGRQDGIRSGMGIIDNKGIVGKVINTSGPYAQAISILNPNFRISASIKNTGYFGNLRWNNADPLRMDLEAVPKHMDLEIGDTVVTSGYSTVFPPEILIGEVENFQIEQGSASYNIVVRLFNDPASFKNVYVVEHLQQQEIDSLEMPNNE